MELLIGIQRESTDAEREARLAHQDRLDRAATHGRDHAHETVHKALDQAHEVAMAAQTHQQAIDQMAAQPPQPDATEPPNG